MSIKLTIDGELEIIQLIDGYKKFHEDYYANDDNHLFKELSENGQQAKIMVISCSDSRVDPAKIFGCEPGDLFMLRNVANLIPPYDPNGGYQAASAALEFAVKELAVQHIMVLGHSQCGGIRALIENEQKSRFARNESFINQWMKLATSARDEVLQQYPDLSQDDQSSLCEEYALKISLQNLQTYKWVTQGCQNNTLKLHAWHFNISTGDLKCYNAAQDRFETLRQ